MWQNEKSGFKKSGNCFHFWNYFVFLQHDNRIGMNINVEYLDEAQAYIDNMDENARKKMLHNVALVRIGVKDSRIFKKISNSGIWEFKAEYESNEYRLLSFWDKTRNSYIMATHGFGKKSQKTPKSEIKHAEKIMNEYYKSK